MNTTDNENTIQELERELMVIECGDDSFMTSNPAKRARHDEILRELSGLYSKKEES